eukprot:gene35357-42849_t
MLRPVDSDSSLSAKATSTKTTPSRKAIVGCIIHSIALGEIEIIEHGALIINHSGIIEDVLNFTNQPDLIEDLKKLVDDVVDYTGKLILPGFVDAHCHAPQYVFSGTGMDLPLLSWLEKYTFPCEARFADTSFARTAYEKSVRRHLKCGTTFASYFGTIHLEASKILVDVLHNIGQRAHVGKVCMDQHAPDFYIEDTDASVKDTLDFVKYTLGCTEAGREWLREVDGATTEIDDAHDKKCSDSEEQVKGRLVGHKRPRAVSVSSVGDGNSPYAAPNTNMQSSPALPLLTRANRACTDDTLVYEWEDDVKPLTHTPKQCQPACQATLLNKRSTPLVIPCITPRFVPTCSAALMHMLSAIAHTYSLPVQSHMSESVAECEWVLSLHPQCSSYAEVYDAHNLLTTNTYMAHCIHTSHEERDLFLRRATGVVHCPSSNFMLTSGICDVRTYLQHGLKVAVGTDVAGGYSPSMLDALRMTVIASRVHALAQRKHFGVGGDCVGAVAKTNVSSDAGSEVASVGTAGQGAKEGDEGWEDIIEGEMEHIELIEGLGPNGGVSACSVVEVHHHTKHQDQTLDYVTTYSTAHPHSPRKASAPSSSSESAFVTPIASAESAVQTKAPAVVAPAAGEPYHPLTYLEAYHLATQGGAEVLGMGEVVGNFLVGKMCDALIVDVAVQDSPIDIWE